MAATKQKMKDMALLISHTLCTVWKFGVFFFQRNLVNTFQTDIEISISGLALEKETKIYRIPTVQTSQSHTSKL